MKVKEISQACWACWLFSMSTYVDGDCQKTLTVLLNLYTAQSSVSWKGFIHNRNRVVHASFLTEVTVQNGTRDATQTARFQKQRKTKAKAHWKIVLVSNWRLKVGDLLRCFSFSSTIKGQLIGEIHSLGRMSAIDLSSWKTTSGLDCCILPGIVSD